MEIELSTSHLSEQDEGFTSEYGPKKRYVTARSLKARLNRLWETADLEAGIGQFEIICEAQACYSAEYSKPGSKKPYVGPPKQQTQPKPRKYFLLDFSPEFSKSVERASTNVRGRILSAIDELKTQPNVVKGDTIKPLTGNLSGQWRYRIGDYRIIYEIDLTNRFVTLVEFDSRGSVYG
jgi:mRNA interferase RelE/StbE